MSDEKQLTIRPCKRWRRVLELTQRKRYLTVSMRAPNRKGSPYTSLAFNSLPVSDCQVMFEPFEQDEATLTVGGMHSTHFGMSRKDGLQVVELFQLHAWTREPSEHERERHQAAAP